MTWLLHILAAALIAPSGLTFVENVHGHTECVDLATHRPCCYVVTRHHALFEVICP